MANYTYRPVVSQAWEDQGLFVMGRLLGNAGTAITQATITSVTYKVYDETAGGTLVTSGTLTKTDVVFDTMQTSDPRWTADDDGFNFGGTIPAAAFPTGDTLYRVEITFDPASGDNFHLVVEHTTSPLRGS